MWSYAMRNWLLLLCLTLLVNACREDGQDLIGPEGPSLALSELGDVFAPAGSIDAVFLEVNQQVPGFAGMVREGGQPVLLLVAGAREEDARLALASRLPGRNLDAASTTSRLADYEWREMAAWHAGVIPMLAIEDVVAVDANERLNRIVLEVTEGTDATMIAQEAVRRGVPSEAVVVRTAVLPVATADLNDKVRPTVGGLRINDSQDYLCTLGFNVNYGGTRTFMTASHCTDTIGVDTDFPFFQDDWQVSGDSIGVEFLDPSFVDYGALCPTGRDDCRWSDAALVSYASSVTWELGHIAKTSSADQWDGSTTIAGSFYINGKYNSPSVGDTLHKMGATTGWTYGAVSETCKSFQMDDQYGVRYMMCQDYVLAGADHGDSGSPVFRTVGADSVQLAGILWASFPDSFFAYSRIGGIEDDFNTSLDVLVPPPPADPEIASCNIEIDEESERARILFATGASTESVKIMRRISFGSQVLHQNMNTSPNTSGYSSSWYYGSYGDYVEFTVRPFSEDSQTGTEGTSCSDSSGIE